MTRRSAAPGCPPPRRNGDASTCLDAGQRSPLAGGQPLPAVLNGCQLRARAERRKEYTMRMLHEVRGDRNSPPQASGLSPQS